MKELSSEPPQYRTSPKISFILGILSGVTVISLLAFIMTFALLHSAFNGTNDNNNNAKVAGAAVNTNTNTAPTNTNTAPPTPVDIKITADDHIKGDSNAKVTLVEYSDFQCPYCATLNTTLDKILTDYKGEVRLVYRQFPLTSLHANAQKAAEASECANDQGKFWEMHDKLFANQSDLSVDNLKKWAKELGLKSSTFDDCLDSGKYTKKVQDQETEGVSYGVEGTPATFVNGTLVSGAQPYDNFKSLIDSLL